MVVVLKEFTGQDSAKKACNLLLREIGFDVSMDFLFLTDKALRRKDEKTEKELEEVEK